MSQKPDSMPRAGRCQFSLRRLLWIAPLLAVVMVFARQPLRDWIARYGASDFAFTTVTTSVHVPDGGTILVVGGSWCTTLCSDEAITALCQSPNAGRYRYLTVDGSQVTDAGLVQLACLSALCRLDIGSNTSTSTTAHRRLCAALPDCEISAADANAPSRPSN